MANRTKRVLIYTASLLVAPVFVMPFEPGTRSFVLSLLPCGVVLSMASLYVVLGEKRKPRSLLGGKLFVTSFITMLFGLALCCGAVVYLTLGWTH